MWAAERNEIVVTDESLICLQHHDDRIRVWRHRGEKMLNSCVMHHHNGLAMSIRTHCTKVLRQIELLLWLTRSPDLSPIENMWYTVAQLMTQITPPAATPDQLWQRVKATWPAVPQEHMTKRVTTVISNNGGY
ncbi:transposable element Tcb1 transposase [Trichonephila clavipes]|nr:transposable element Tcb1 transposase [Trichonephila clavipes]